MNSVVLENANIIQPSETRITVYDVTTSSQEKDLSSAEVWNGLNGGRMVTMAVDAGNLWFNFGPASSGSVDEDAMTGEGNDQAFVLAAGEKFSFFLKDLEKYFRFKGSVATYVRLYVSSRPPSV